MKKKDSPRQSKKTLRTDSHQEIQIKELILTWRDILEDKRKQWRLHRKLMAKSTPLEFCLRPQLALLIYAMALSLLGRGLCHLQGETVYWAFWWNETWAAPLAWLSGSSWSDYSMSISIEQRLLSIESVLMISFLILGAVCAYAPRRLSQSLKSHGQASSLDLRGAKVTRKKVQTLPEGQRLAEPPKSTQWFARAFLLAAVMQAFYLFCLWLSHEYRWASVLEHLLQLSLPIACWMMLPFQAQSWEKPAENLVLTCLSLCFLGHGLYALDIAPLPTDFVNMTMQILHIEEDSARSFLTIVGSLDILVALLVFIPIHELRRSALLYMMFWGGLTAVARPLGQPFLSFSDHIIQWGPECIWRLTHAVIPLWLWLRRYSI